LLSAVAALADLGDQFLRVFSTDPGPCPARDPGAHPGARTVRHLPRSGVKPGRCQSDP